jgi:hypothetical protein
MATPPPDFDSGSIGTTFGSALERSDILFHTDEVLDGLAKVPLAIAGVVVVVGALCVINGYRWHKWIIVVLALLGGLGLGYKLSEHMGRSNVVAVSIGALCAIIATPLLRITVAVFGGLTGSLIGANAWTAVNAPVEADWAGALIGFIIVAMASLVAFRLVIVLFTSIGGAAMVVLGTITILLGVPGWNEQVRDSLSENTTLVPMLTLVAGVAGFVLQQSRLKSDGVKLMGGAEESHE